MTVDDLFFITEVGRSFSFVFNSKEYSLFYDKDKEGNKLYVFGPIEDLKYYKSFGELMTQAMVENHFFKEMLQDLSL